MSEHDPPAIRTGSDHADGSAFAVGAGFAGGAVVDVGASVGVGAGSLGLDTGDGGGAVDVAIGGATDGFRDGVDDGAVVAVQAPKNEDERDRPDGRSRDADHWEASVRRPPRTADRTSDAPATSTVALADATCL